MHGYLITYFLSSFNNRNVVIDTARNYRRLRVIFPMIYLDIEKYQATIPQYKNCQFQTQTHQNW